MDKKREYRVTIELLGEVAEYRPGGSRLEDLGWLESGEPAKVSAFRGHSYNLCFRNISLSVISSVTNRSSTRESREGVERVIKI